MSRLVAIGDGADRFYLNPDYVVSMTWDRGYSFTNLIIMTTLDRHVVRDWNGSAYDAERKILAAMEAD